MTQGPLSISVALCTYNGARYIEEQVQSICAQTRRPMEIVLSDDASTDDCVALARKVVARFAEEREGPPVVLRILRNAKALRVVKNFEQAALACEGDLIALCDQDDVWHPQKLARMAERFEQQQDLLLLHTDARLVDGDLRYIGHSLFHALEVKPFELDWLHGGKAFDVYLRRNLATGAATMFRRPLLAAAAPFPVEWVHDEWLAIVASAIGRVDVMEEPLFDYRQHASNQIGARRDTFSEKVKKALASRGDTHVKRAIKAELLLARLVQLGDRVPADVVAKTRSKIEHQRFRAALPAHRLARVVPVSREALTGRYAKFGRGLRGVVRDLFESV